VGGARFLSDAARNPFPDEWQNGWWNNNGLSRLPPEKRTREAIRNRLRGTVHAAYLQDQQRIVSRVPGVMPVPGATPVLISAWNDEPLLPLTIDGRRVREGDHVNLVLVHAPSPAPQSARADKPFYSAGWRNRRRLPIKAFCAHAADTAACGSRS
jgi:hypothetical protein